MEATSSGGSERSLEQTPTWAVTVVCSAFVIISLLIENAIHHLGTWLSRRNKKALYDALEKVKAELMLMGFISFLLTVGQKPISKICIPKGIAYSMLPCQKEESIAAGTDHCSEQGKYPLVSLNGMNQLHYLVFTLATVHVLYSVLTIALARAKMRRWKTWEKEIVTMDYQFSHDPSRFRLTEQTTFVRRYMNLWSRTPILKWVVCFFRQFFRSIRKVDYLTLRHGFIMAHFSANNKKFNFHKYIKRSLDDDFKRVIGISFPLWAFAMGFLLINLHKWNSYFWFSFVPLAIVLIVGMKLQLIILEMALGIQGRHAVVRGIPVVQPTDKLFWFNRPDVILFLIHFTLFQNAFQLAFLSWTCWQFGLNSCFHDRLYTIILRIVIGILVQFICSYVTLPLYALVTQMGSQMKNTIFDEQVVSSLIRWHERAKKNIKKRNSSQNTIFEEGVANGLRRWHQRAEKNMKPRNSNHTFSSRIGISESGFSSRWGSVETTPSHGSSPLHLMRRYSTMGDIETPDISPRYYLSDYEATEFPEYSEVTAQNPVSDQVESLNLEMVASSSYVPQPIRTASISETWGVKEVTKEPPTSEDVNININSRDEFSFVMS
eukprot:PITA_24490